MAAQRLPDGLLFLPCNNVLLFLFPCISLHRYLLKQKNKEGVHRGTGEDTELIICNENKAIHCWLVLLSWQHLGCFLCSHFPRLCMLSVVQVFSYLPTKVGHFS